MAKGKFIAFEGVDGCGKSTQISRLNSYLNSKNIDTLLTREPGGTLVAEQIRAVVKAPLLPLDLNTELLLFSAARSHHVQTLILPNLNEGKTVICDRYYLSTLVYQKLTTRLNPTTLKALEELSFNSLIPDLTIVLELPLEQCIARIVSRGETRDHFEQTERLSQVITDYKTMSYPNHPNARIHRINAAQPIEAISAEVQRVVASL